MVSLAYSPPWFNAMGQVEDPTLLGKVAELQGDFFNWLYECGVDVKSQRLPTCNPVTLFTSLMVVSLPPRLADLKDLILNRVEKPQGKVKLSSLYGDDLSEDMSVKWTYSTSEGITTVSMTVCDSATKDSFLLEESLKAKVLLFEGLLMHLSKTERTVDGATTPTNLMRIQPILSALYSTALHDYSCTESFNLA